MDPVSIINAAFGASKVTYTVSVALYTFVNATKNVDQSVKSLVAEVDGLHRALDAIANTLKEPTVASNVAQGDGELLKSLDDVIDDCRKTVQILADTLKRIDKSGSKRFFSKPLKQIKLNINDDEIKTFRSQIHTYSLSLEMTLQAMNLRVTCSSPNIVVDHLNPKIEALADLITALDRHQSHDAADYHAASSFDRQVTTHRTEKLKKSAEAIVSSASTVAGRTTTVGDGSDRASTGGSRYGEPLSHRSRSHIEGWLAQPINEEGSNTTLETLVSGAQNESISLSRDKWSSSPPVAAFGGQAGPVPAEEHYSDEELEFEAVQKCLQKARLQCDQELFAEAEPLLRYGLSCAKKMSLKRRNLLDLKEADLRLAVACFCQEKVEESELIFSALTKDFAVSDGEAAHILHASHYLAQVHKSKLNFESALDHCVKAVNGRRRVFGKEHPDYYASLYLLASIHAANENAIAAASYADLIPADYSARNQESLFTRLLCKMEEKERMRKEKQEKENKQQKEEQERREEQQKKAEEQRKREERQRREGEQREKPELKQENERQKQSALSELSDAGFNVNSEGFDASKALQRAAQNPKCTALQLHLLVEKGANIDAKYGDGWTPLLTAAYHGNEAAIRLLLEKGANIEAKDNSEWTPLLWATARGHKAAVRLLLEKGANVEAENGSGWTPLLRAADCGNEAAVRLLLEKGANIEAKSSSGTTPLLCATSYVKEATIQLLLEKGANIEAEDNYGWTPLLWATARGHKAAVRLLLEKGANIEAKTSSGTTLLSLATSQGHKAVVQLLTEYENKGKGGKREQRNVTARHSKGS